MKNAVLAFVVQLPWEANIHCYCPCTKHVSWRAMAGQAQFRMATGENTLDAPPVA
jgi:hypothetical protein